MSYLNKIMIIGSVGNDPEYKYFESGVMLTKFCIANNQYDSKTKKDVTHWFNVDTFSKLGEYIKKGYLVAVEGRLKTNTYKDATNSIKKTSYIFAENIQILTSKNKENVVEKTENEDEIVKFSEFSDEEITF